MDLKKRLAHYRLSQAEYAKICEVLGREPKGIEWALFSALWSEHCSYKSSRVHLKKFYSKNKRVLESFGENAGVIDLGQGERVAFKMESHNHPSFIEPYQGAATGVGGILRDIFTMGARPIALADYLCFGEAHAPRMSTLIDGVVRGIGGYGNCVGVPTITGQTEFHSSYNGNILVNALALGLFRPGEPVVNSKARGPGNCVVYVGAKTGKDGVHGASMASESFADDNVSKKPTVQIGDPFYEKLLIESCIEVMQQNLVVAIQDMGAAGLTSSSFEMAAKGNVGLTLHLDKVPLRDASVTPEEILLSESQERMLLICEPDKITPLKKVFESWGLDAQIIGEVIQERRVDLFWKGDLLTSIDPCLLTDSAPMYERAFTPWLAKNRVENSKAVLCEVDSAESTLLKILNDHRGTNRSWIYRQYDQRVGGKTVRDCEESFGILRLPDSGRGLALALGCRPHVMRFDAYQGAMDAICYPAIEMALKGFEPLAVTDCLNFGNPEKPEVMSEFVATVEGMSKACKALDVPVISGNVSFYNETLNLNVTSTPSTGLVGLCDRMEALPKSYFAKAGQSLALLSLPMLEISGYVAELENKKCLGVGDLQAEIVADFVQFLREASYLNSVSANRLVGKFGLAYALARMTSAEIGCEVKLGDWLSDPNLPAASLFSETMYQVVFCGEADLTKDLEALLQNYPNLQGELRIYPLGKTCSEDFIIDDEIKLSIEQLQASYGVGLEANLEALA